jgi:hypothetical protein
MEVNEQIKERWEELLRKGVLLVSGVDEDGDFEFNFDIEKLKEVDPDLYHQHMDEVDSALMNLFVKGIVDLDFSEEEVSVSLTERGREWASAYEED